ncbi:Vegetative incompatibility protein [Drechslerella dactyloides]|uniref:Vegetative incompatibility protein n=1 Tax=Drechslerella dactyloides TaxID=74499 RepID=A0AAD6ISF1_DREDA|nr:Vegetative incompatibility protein [Drechslerella dactyloides]
MDPLSTIASVIAVLQLTAAVVNCLNEVKNASKDQKRLAIEASNLFALLTSLKYRIEEANTTDPWYARAHALTVENGPLSQYKDALELLVTKLVPKHGAGKVVAAFTWPYNKGEVAEILTTIERLKSTISIALEMDHFKLSEAIKTETGQIPGVVRDLETIRRNQDSQKLRDITKWLSAIDFTKQQSDFSNQRQEGTGIWFLKFPEFVDWLSGTSPILFCHGIPGAGKTIISSLVIDHLQKSKYSGRTGVAYIYCNYKESKQQRPIDLLSALLKQLVQGLPKIPNVVQTLYNEHMEKRSQSAIDEIVTTILDVFCDYHEVFIVVDALDECSDEHRDSLMSRLRKLLAPNVKMMVTSRPNISSQAFENGGHNTSNVIHLEIVAHKEDVARFVEGQLHRLAGCVSRNLALKQLVISTINEAVNGMFILARLLVESLVGETTPKAIKSVLRSLPKGSQALYHAYEGAVERIKSGSRSQLAEAALSWIVWARRPLSVKELQHALAIEVGECQLDEENITDISDVVSACTGLISVDGQSDVVRLVHYTAYEYFADTWISTFPETTAKEDITTA